MGLSPGTTAVLYLPLLTSSLLLWRLQLGIIVPSLKFRGDLKENASEQGLMNLKQQNMKERSLKKSSEERCHVYKDV